MNNNDQALTQLATLYGVQTSYYDITGQRREASPEPLLMTLRALGAPVDSIDDVPAALRQRHRALWNRSVEPVIVAWHGEPASFVLRLPQGAAAGTVVCRLQLESGGRRRWILDLDELSWHESEEVDGVRYLRKTVALPDGVPWGYHTLRVEAEHAAFESLVVAAPTLAYTDESASTQEGRTWGVFLPLYALHTQKSWGSGDFGDLKALMEWTAELGGGVVGTLPLLAAFLDDPFEPSPYAPVSRLFWNEFYVDIARAPELKRSPIARSLLESSEFQDKVDRLRQASGVDYRRQMALKRDILEELAQTFFSEPSRRPATFRRFLESHPQVDDYARFRATCDRQRVPWREWPARLRAGLLQEGDYDPDVKRYHLYVQWLAHEQLGALTEEARDRGMKLYLDLPLGTHADGYDVWRERALYTREVAAGSPPDTFFTKGQNWGFPPLHPDTMREQGYRHVIAYLRHHLRHAKVLRIDHVMSLHRLFWIPHGVPAWDGVYVRYPSEELHAVLNLESQRHHSLIVGEDLGTVPDYVREAMDQHDLYRMYVLQYELTTEYEQAIRPVPSNALASMNTHDMPTFTGFWQGLDILERQDLDLLGEEGVRSEEQSRLTVQKALVNYLQQKGWLEDGKKDMDERTVAVLKGCLAHLAGSPAKTLLVNLEDLWLETRPQNVPGTTDERPNWRRKARYSFEAFRRMPEVVDVLLEIDELRRRGDGTS